MAQLNPLENEARDLIDQVHQGDRWTPQRQMVLRVFKAMYSAAMPYWQIEQIAAAMYNQDRPNLKPELTRLVKEKVLRSRMVKGERVYELNLS
jgi:hypothetical protein